jgi:hypothetical protein
MISACAGPARRRVGWLPSRDVGLSGLLAALVLVVFVLRPLVDLGLAGRRLIELGMAVVVLLAMWTVWGGPARMIAVGLAVGISEAMRALYWLGNVPRLAPWVAFSSAIAIGILMLLVLGTVSRARAVTGRQIRGAVAVYLLFALAWAQLYELVEALAPGSFVFPQGHTAESGWFSPLLYFSFITLTTLGYGDILPAHAAARSLAMLEALVGQLYPAILLARLVSLHAGTEQAVESDETPAGWPTKA